MFKFIKTIVSLAILSSLYTNCKKNEVENISAPLLPPTLTSFEITDNCLRKVTINGTNFNPDISKDSIFFGTSKGIIDSATSTKIFARYPSGSLSGNVTVYCNGLSAVSANSFVIIFPVLTSFSPATAGPGGLITITGQNFNPNPAADSVFINNVKATIVSASATQIVVRVPASASSGVITVYSNCQVVSSTLPFEFSNKGIVYTSGQSGFCYAIDISSGTVIWKTQTNSGFSSGPTYDNGKIYIGSTNISNYSDNHMYSLDALTGQVLWRTPAGPFVVVPAKNQGAIFAGDGNYKLHAFNSITGQINWSFPLLNFVPFGPTYYNGNIYTSDGDRDFCSINAATGVLNWKKTILPGGSAAAVNGTIYTEGSFVLYALDAVTGAIKWTFTLGSNTTGSSPTIVNGILYLADNHRLYALNAATGAVIWDIVDGSCINTDIVVSNNILYLHKSNGTLEARESSAGNLLWSKVMDNGSLPCAPVVANGIVFLGDYFGDFHAVNALTGATIWKIDLGLAITSSACVVDQNGILYHGGDAGYQH